MQAVNGDGALAWSPVVSLPTSRPHVPPAEAPTYIRLTTAAGKVGLACKAGTHFNEWATALPQKWLVQAFSFRLL